MHAGLTGGGRSPRVINCGCWSTYDPDGQLISERGGVGTAIVCRMRAALIRSGLVLAVAGAVSGVLVALGLRWWNVAHAPERFGFVSFAPLPTGANFDALGIEVGTGWWASLWPGAVTGLAVGAFIALGFGLLGRRLTLERTS
jgi:hypothetical protein